MSVSGVECKMLDGVYICEGERRCFVKSNSFIFDDIGSMNPSSLASRVMMIKDSIMEASYFRHKPSNSIYFPCVYKDGHFSTGKSDSDYVSCKGEDCCKCNHIHCNDLDYARLDDELLPQEDCDLKEQIVQDALDRMNLRYAKCKRAE